MKTFQTAELLAADLAGARVDHNEAQKVLAYVRSQRSSKALFDYLQAVVSNGRAVIRSNQTLDYYRSLQNACTRHLRGMDYEELIWTLGWAIRLMRYYRDYPDKAPKRTVDGGASTQEPTVQQPSDSAGGKTQSAQGGTPAPVKSVSGIALQVGSVFTGKVIEDDENYFVIEVPGYSSDKVIAVLKRDESTPKFVVNKDSARVEVTGIREARSGRTILDVRRAPKAKSKG
ncbi:hypothetical protein [Roseiflexus sp.]|uniref:hypothetical protein n=1 Tax=Roseiflexus sp. TaxID=2562120 RepID=UPI00398BBC10